MAEQVLVFVVLALALVLFILDRWRYDIVALLALLTLTVAGVIPASEAFSGFGHPAVITVAAVLVVSRGLANSGLVEAMARGMGRIGDRPGLQVAALLGSVTVCSAFMNNVGALALLMPLALRMADNSPSLTPGRLLMPLAFASLLGGMTTLIGTPPNIIVGSLRAEIVGEPYALFDYSPVGLAVALVGVLFLGLFSHRLMPRRKAQHSAAALFEIAEYTTELRLLEDTPAAGRMLREVAAEVDAEFIVVAIEREGNTLYAPHGEQRLRAGDRMIVEAAPEVIHGLARALGASTEGQDREWQEVMTSKEVSVLEAVVLPRSRMQERTAEQLQLRARHSLNLLAVARRGQRLKERLKRIRFQPGDVLLVQCLHRDGADTLAMLGCLPLADRDLRLGRPPRLLLAVGIFVSAVVTLLLGWLSAAVAFTVAAVAMVLTRLVELRSAYRSVDLSVVVLLAAMIPVGGALESTGGAQRIADLLGHYAQSLPLPLTLGLVMVLAMVLSDVMNNAATAVIMAPIAADVARSLGASPDPFLMAVAIGASCAFLTPIGHQSNTLVMGPGGYRFGDYWRLGLPLEILILVLSVPVLLWFWPA